jgi:hypothetical protein
MMMASSAHADICDPIDYKSYTLPKSSLPHEIASVLLGYPSISFDKESGAFMAQDGTSFRVEGTSSKSASEILASPTFGDQFRYVYPLEFDLTKRAILWEDPGRVRNAKFMSFLFFDNENEARSSLRKITVTGTATRFRVTRKHGVDCQLEAALESISGRYPEIFSDVGGSFNWRNISGTNRLSIHSYGAAIDVNATLGGYWKWSGQKQGNVGAFENKIPEEVVEAMERFGFIWGGKWHHFDGMHFEFRPEIILYARLLE